MISTVSTGPTTGSSIKDLTIGRWECFTQGGWECFTQVSGGGGGSVSPIPPPSNPQSFPQAFAGMAGLLVGSMTIPPSSGFNFKPLYCS